jgi:hypothetical protein
LNAFHGHTHLLRFLEAHATENTFKNLAAGTIIESKPVESVCRAFSLRNINHDEGCVKQEDVLSFFCGDFVCSVTTSTEELTGEIDKRN